MATLMTVDRLQFSFDPDSVAVVTDHDAGTGVAVTCVYGIANSDLHIAESVAAFLSRLGITTNFAQLTRPNDSPVWIQGKAVSSIRVPLPDEYIGSVNAVVTTGVLTQGVKETPAAAVAQINAHGGKL